MRQLFFISFLFTFIVLSFIIGCKKDEDEELNYLKSFYHVNQPYTFIFKNRIDSAKSIKITLTMDEQGYFDTEETLIPRDSNEIKGAVLFMPSSEYDLNSHSIYQTQNNEINMYHEFEKFGMVSSPRNMYTGKASSNDTRYFLECYSLSGRSSNQDFSVSSTNNIPVWNSTIDSCFISGFDMSVDRVRYLIFFQSKGVK